MSSLNNSELEEIKNLYNAFKNELKTNIQNRKTINKGKCYLIKKEWDTEFNNNINKHNSIKKPYRKFSQYQNQSNEPFNFPDKPPEFITINNYFILSKIIIFIY